MRVVLIFLLIFSCVARAEDQATSPQGAGQHELDLVVHDLPELKPVLSDGPAIQQWLVDAFNAFEPQTHVKWQSSQKNSYIPAEAQSSAYPNFQHNLYVWVDETYKAGPHQGQPRTDEEILADLVYELNNIKFWSEKEKIAESVEDGSISRDNFISSSAREEFKACLLTKKFYSSVWVPYCTRIKAVPHGDLWHATMSSSFDEALRSYPPTSWWPWQFYGRLYDWCTWQRSGDDDLRKGDAHAAVDCYTNAIELGNRSYFWRAVAEESLQEDSLALNDLEKVAQMDSAPDKTRDSTVLLISAIYLEKGDLAQAYQTLDAAYGTHHQMSTNWAQEVADFLRGRKTREELLSDSARFEKTDPRFQRSRALFYCGVKSAANADPKGMRSFLKRSIECGSDHTAEWHLAKALLKRAQRLPVST